jgi:hypothetical protein
MRVKNIKLGLEGEVLDGSPLKNITPLFKQGREVIPYCDLKRDGCYDTSCNRRCPFYNEWELVDKTGYKKSAIPKDLNTQKY